MKVSIGSKIVQGPWGGGNLFAINLSNYLLDHGHQVIYDLSEPDIDLILLTDPRSRSESSSTFNHLEIQKYIKYVNPAAVVVQRINECDERKNTENINNFYLEASKVADHVIFVSEWLRQIYLKAGMEEHKTSVIMAGANSSIFNPRGSQESTENQIIKIVTHHWSSHINKGFKAYKDLDSLMGKTKWKDKIEFTYIGNYSKDHNLVNTKILEPLAGEEMALELKNHHIYITGSINEPSGNHHIEASQCGLPVLYINSGGIPEYCHEYGLAFEHDNLEEKLEYLIENYKLYKNKLNSYPFNAEKMSGEFYKLFNNLIQKNLITKPEQVYKLRGIYYLKKNYLANKLRFILNLKNNTVSIFISKIRNLKK